MKDRKNERRNGICCEPNEVVMLVIVFFSPLFLKSSPLLVMCEYL